MSASEWFREMFFFTLVLRFVKQALSLDSLLYPGTNSICELRVNVGDWKMPRSCAMLDILFGMVATIGLDSEELATVEAVTLMQYQNKMD